MAKASAKLTALRAEARARHKAAGRKVSRLNTQKGVKVSGTKYDPRRNGADIANMGARELKTYINTINKFTDRKTQFVPDVKARPIPTAVWDRYKAKETKYNERVSRDYDSVKDIYIEPLNATVDQRMAAATPDHRQMGNPSVNSPYKPPNRDSVNVASLTALEKLTKNMAERNKRDFSRKQLAENKRIFGEMMDVINMPDLVDKVENLTARQFHILWNYTTFATAISTPYEIAKNSNAGPLDSWEADTLDTELAEAERLVDWAQTLTVGR